MTYLAMMQLYRGCYPAKVFALFEDMKEKKLVFLSRHIQEVQQVCADDSNLARSTTLLEQCEKEGIPVTSLMMTIFCKTAKSYAVLFGPAAADTVTASFDTATRIVSKCSSNQGKRSHTGEVQDPCSLSHTIKFAALLACDALESLHLMLQNDKIYKEVSVVFGSALRNREINGVLVSDEAHAVLCDILRSKLMNHGMPRTKMHFQDNNIKDILATASKSNEWRHLSQAILPMSNAAGDNNFPPTLTNDLLPHLLIITNHAPHAATSLIHQLPVAPVISSKKHTNSTVCVPDMSSRRVNDTVAGLFQSIQVTSTLSLQPSHFSTLTSTH